MFGSKILKFLRKEPAKDNEPEKKTQKFAKMFGEDRAASLPPIFKDDNASDFILSSLQHEMKVECPAIVIDWNDGAFNNYNISRNNDPTHTKQTLINFIKNAGGHDVCDRHIVFLFRTERDLCECIYGLPAWSRRQANIPDVAHSVTKIIKLTVPGTYDIARCDTPFNWP